MSAQEIVLPPTGSVGIRRTRVVAIAPLALALVGVAALLLARGPHDAANMAAAAGPAVDPVVTGSIVSADEQARAMKMLDR
jgi:hypothetical protein